MKLLKWIRAGAVLIVLASLAFSAAPAAGAPLAETNLAKNPGFEGGSYLHDGDSQLQAPADWSIWWYEPADGCYNWRPRFEVTNQAGRVHSGAYAGRYYSSGGSYTAGFWQAVQVTPGKTYRFTIWGMAWSTENPAQEGSTTTTAMKIGIDPNGGVSPTAASIVWSGVASATDAYRQFTVEATASGSQITIWVYNRPDWCVAWNDVFWDDASVVEAAAAPTTAPAATPVPTTAPATDYRTGTPDASGRIVHTVQPGDTLSGIAWTYGVTVDQIRSLNGLTSDIIVLGAQLVIQSGAAPAATPAPTAEATEVAVAPTEEPVVSEPEPVVEEPSDTSGTTGNGTICVMSYEDGNGNGIREAGEERLAGITFALSDGAQVVARYTTDGINEPYCFVDIASGSYIVSWTADTFEPTTEQNWAVQVSGGAIYQQEFGIRPAGSGSAQSGGAGGSTPRTGLIILVVVIGVIVLVGAAGAVYLLVLRRRKI